MKKRLYLILDTKQIDKISDLSIPNGYKLEDLSHQCNLGNKVKLKIGCECGDTKECYMYITTQSHYLMEMTANGGIKDDNLADDLINAYKAQGFNLSLIEDDFDRVTFYSTE